ncbi:MAG: isoleucine--tRNA ligase [Candidatus Eiseniibacteriota bacterium]
MSPLARELYPEAAFDVPLQEAEEEILALWRERDVFRRTVDTRRGARPFVFYEGPPTANGRPGVHHVLARVMKDLVCRYQTMRGRLVLRRGGWDTHGLPVELEVEKQLGIADKREIVKFGVGEFNRRCRDSVFTYLDEWRRLTERIAYWVDLDDEYVTLKNEYIESVWAALRAIHEKGMIYRGFKTVPYSTKSGTVLSDHEVALGYREVDDPSVTVRCRLEDEPSTSLLVWTTTPWTLPGNAALAVHPDVEYVTVEVRGERVILAADLRDAVIPGEGEIVARTRGRELAGRRYVPLYDDHASLRARHPAAWTVVCEKFVTTSDGTGVVHIAPGFGADDLEAGTRHDLPRIVHVDDEGQLAKELRVGGGLWFKDADPVILRDLQARGLVWASGTYRHTYPFNWRGQDPLMYVAREAWYVRTTAFRDRLVSLNREIHWVPGHIRDGRFGNWLENNVDWALSRERFWGTPLPFWVSDRDPERVEVVGSVAELSAKAGRDLSGLDLHRPAVDEISWPDGKGGTMRRVPEVLDVWFDSGAMPYAQWHYPFENRELAESQFPADYICEAIDQTRGWFYSLHALGTILRDSPAYRACLVTGHILGEDGQKMSKSIGNTVDPWDAVALGGADALRWYLTVTNNPTSNMRFVRDGVREVARKLLDTMVNVYRFFARYANLDGWPADAAPVRDPDRTLLDRWVRSRLHSLIGDYHEAFDRLEPWRAGRALEQFVMEDLSNWYVRRSRSRFWAHGMEADKRAAYATLHECIETATLLAAPFLPFLAERLWQTLRGAGGQRESVHLETCPQADPACIDALLERRMEHVRHVVRLGRAGRNRANVKTRQPLARVRIGSPEGEELGDLLSIVLDELNVKSAEAVRATDEKVELGAKARFDVLGPRFGKDVKQIAAAIQALSPDEIRALERDGSARIRAAGSEHEITSDEVLVRHQDPEGWVLEREGGWSVALDLEIGEDLRQEGFAREIVNKIQFMRKKAGFDITDRIEVAFEGTDALRSAVGRHDELIRRECQADRIQVGPARGETREEWKINGEPAVLALTRVR